MAIRTRVTASAARIRYAVGKGGLAGATPVVAVVMPRVFVFVVEALLVVALEDDEALPVEVVVMVVVVDVVVVIVLEVLVLLAWTNIAVIVSGPPTVAAVIGDVEFSKAVLPVEEAHLEKL